MRGLGAFTGGHDDLLVLVVGHVAGREHAADPGVGAAGHMDLAVDVGVGEVQHEVRVGEQPDLDEHAVDPQVALLAGVQIAHPQAFDDLFALDLERLVTAQRYDPLGRTHLVPQHRVAGEVGAADQVDLLGDAVHLDRRLKGGVAAADHGDRHVAVEGSVAGGAVHDAAAGELRLAGDVQMALLGAAGDDDGAGLDLFARSELQHLGPALHVHADDLLTDEPLQPVHVGLLEEQAHQVRPVHQRHAGVVGHRMRDAHLAAQVVGDQDRAQVLAGGIHGRRESRRPAADHRYVPDFGEVDVARDAQDLVQLAGGVHVGDGVVAADPLTVDEDLRHASLPGGLGSSRGRGPRRGSRRALRSRCPCSRTAPLILAQ